MRDKMDEKELRDIIKDCKKKMEPDDLKTQDRQFPQLCWILLLKCFEDFEKNRSHVDKDFKESTDFSFSVPGELNTNSLGGQEVIGRYDSELQAILNEFLELYKYAAHVPRFSLVEAASIQHYLPTQGFKEFHFERGGKETHDRHLVFMTYLNSVDDCGETEFFYQDYKCKAVKGKTVIWPSDWTHTHRGVVSKTEEKFIITGWFSYQ